MNLRHLARRLLHFLEGALAHGAFALFGVLPIDWASAIGGSLARTIGPLLPVSRRARRNLIRAYPDKSAQDQGRIVRGMWDNLGRTVAEYPHIAAFWDDRIPADRTELLRLLEGWDEASNDPVFFRGRRIEVAGLGNLRRILAHDGPAIFFSAHMGNWEVMPLWAARVGIPVAVVYRTPNNPYIAHLIERLRAGNGPLLPKGLEGALASVRVLEEGGRLGMLVDQKQNRGIAVPLFGRDAMTAPTLAKLMIRFNCPAFGVWVQRLGGARVRLTFAPSIEPPGQAMPGDESAAVAAIMKRVNAMLESWIRERPDQWMWLHRRWPD